MKKLLAIIAICLAILSTGCFEKKEDISKQTTQQTTEQKQTMQQDNKENKNVATNTKQNVIPDDPEAIEVEADDEEDGKVKNEEEIEGVVVEWDNDEDGKTNIANDTNKNSISKTNLSKPSTINSNANYDYYYETVTIIDPNINTPLGTMEIPAGWSYKPNIIWNASGGNIVGGISAIAPDGIESFWYQPISVGLPYVKAEAEYNYQVAELKKRITNLKVVESTTEPNQKIKDQINTLLNTYRNVQVPLAHNGSYTYKNAKITGKINGIDTVTVIEILSIRLPIPKSMYHAPVKLPDGRVIDTNIGEIVTCVKTVKAEHEPLLAKLDKKISKLIIDKRWLSARDRFASQLAQIATKEIAQSRARMSNIVSQHISDINNIAREMQQGTSESMDRVREAWGYYRTGQTLVESPTDGRRTVDSTANHIWQSTDGTIITSDSPAFDPNSGGGLIDKEWTEMQIINPLENQNGQ